MNNIKRLNTIQHWVFDMDGTLTLPKHDFAFMCKQLGLPNGQTDILAYLSMLNENEANSKRQWLFDYGINIAENAMVAEGAKELIQYLYKKNVKLGLLTRNDRKLALITLRKIELLPYFEPDAILGRDEAKPKPHPEGLLKIIKFWQASPSNCVMVGDYSYDLDVGKNAGVKTILVNQPINPWPKISDYYYESCQSLLDQLVN